jgi:hypothetical protein
MNNFYLPLERYKAQRSVQKLPVKIFSRHKNSILKKGEWATPQQKIPLSSVSCYFLICSSSFILIGAVLFLESGLYDLRALAVVFHSFSPILSSLLSKGMGGCLFGLLV